MAGEETLSIKDGLTGCFNRRKLRSDMKTELARASRYENPISLLMIDIDWFKKYNDIHGHAKGDELLTKMANIFMDNARVVDRVYRYGGEEFIILLPETDKVQALSSAKRLQALVEKTPFEGEKESQPNEKVTVSIGVVSFPWDATFQDELLKIAHSALQKAKQAGKNRICYFDNIRNVYSLRPASENCSA